MRMEKYLVDRHSDDLWNAAFFALDNEPDTVADDCAQVAAAVQDAFEAAVKRIYGIPETPTFDAVRHAEVMAGLDGDA